MSFEKKTLLHSVRRALSLHALLTGYDIGAISNLITWVLNFFLSAPLSCFVPPPPSHFFLFRQREGVGREEFDGLSILSKMVKVESDG